MFYNKNVLKNQIEFQKLFGLDLTNLTPEKQFELGEKYLQKAIEEVVELRKTFPTGLGFIEKHTPQISRSAMLREFIDIQLFLANFYLTWGFSDEELEAEMNFIQANNFSKIRPKAITNFNETLVKIGNEVGYKKIGVGRGNSTPKYIFVGQNPAQTIENGEEVFKLEYRDHRAAGNILLNLLDKHGLLVDSYFTNAVKNTTANNAIPDKADILFWQPWLLKELQILSANNQPLIVPLGAVAKKATELPGIRHPATCFYGTSQDDYEAELITFIKENLKCEK